jgi:hypothetical protein
LLLFPGLLDFPLLIRVPLALSSQAAIGARRSVDNVELTLLTSTDQLDETTLSVSVDGLQYNGAPSSVIGSDSMTCM